MSFLLDENSAAAKLLARQDAYLELYREMHDDQDLNGATEDYLKHAIESNGHLPTGIYALHPAPCSNASSLSVFIRPLAWVHWSLYPVKRWIAGKKETQRCNKP
ncbi:MAG: hypothetical protein HC808_18420 [Candidatus Competibacteraceae bacterium]|nr:hypothetical protein [Candidatus Competibacteraceae bacterium]